MRTRWQLHGLVVSIGVAGTAVVHWATAPYQLPPAVLWVAGALLGFVAAERVARRQEGVLVPLTGLLVALGLVNTYRLQPQLVAYHAAWVCVGLAVMLLACHLGASRRLHAVARPAAIFLVALPGLAWLGWGTMGGLGPVQLPSQLVGELASEPVLVALVVWAAVELQTGTVRRQAAVVWASAVGLSAARGDLGVAAVLTWTGLAMAYCAIQRTRLVVYAAAGVAALGILACRGFPPSLWERLVGWINPWADPAGAGYALVQARFALGAGGLLGTGPGQGHPELVPGALGPMALAALGEEWGFAGVLAVLSAYALWVGRAFRVSLRAADPVGRSVGLGAATTIAAQTVLAAGGATGLLPRTDLVLPFVAYGGVSLASHLALVGLVLGLTGREGTS